MRPGDYRYYHSGHLSVFCAGNIIGSMKTDGHRLSFLIVESEPQQGLSTRKLLIESAKHNVVTAHSAKEGLEMFKRFPNVDAVVIDSELKDNEQLARQVKEQNRDIQIVCLTARVAAKAPWADETANPHDPAELLKMLERMGGRTDI
jgi:CheY-like chemotaxis protein